MDLQSLLDIKSEIKRFNKRLDAAIDRFKKEEYAKFGCKESGAVRRGALDLKNELTKITK